MDDQQLPETLDAVARRLADDRPQPAPERLAAMRRRVGGRAHRRQRRVLVTVIAVGALLTTGGTGLAVSGLSGSTVRGVAAQYPLSGSAPSQSQGDQTPPGTTTGSDDDGGEPAPAGDREGRETKNARDLSDVGSGGDAPPVQAPRQLSASGEGGLPFTGYLAIPVLIAGVSLLLAGVILRRRTARLPA